MSREPVHPTHPNDAEAREEAERKAAADKQAAADKEAAPAQTLAERIADKPVRLDLLIALLATDWLIGDKHHYAILRQQTVKLLTQIGEDGTEALLRLEGTPNRVITTGDAPVIAARRIGELEELVRRNGGTVPPPVVPLVPPHVMAPAAPTPNHPARD